MALGLGSNMIVRDGGIEGVTIRLMGGYWGKVEPAGPNSLFARAGALDLSVAKAAAKAGLAGLSFFSGTPGTRPAPPLRSHPAGRRVSHRIKNHGEAVCIE